MNLNTLAVEVCKREGKKVQVNIAQVKEVIRCTMDVLADHNWPMVGLVQAQAIRAYKKTRKDTKKGNKK
jgi:hypothetical protein